MAYSPSRSVAKHLPFRHANAYLTYSVKDDIVAAYDWSIQPARRFSQLVDSAIHVRKTFYLIEKMASLGLHLLSLVLAVTFIFLGHIKLTPQFFPEYHSQVKNEFGKLNKEFPFYHLTGWRPYAKNYRIAVGMAEMSAGTLLLLAGGLRKEFEKKEKLYR